MGVPTSEGGYTSGTTGRGDHEVHDGHVGALGGGGTHTKPTPKGTNRLKAAVLRSENWSVSKSRFITEYNKNFTIFTNNIYCDKL
jgi:hypothetical protein